MMMSKTSLMNEAKSNQYKPEILEKVYRLLLALDQIMSVPFLRERLVLKGGTALNLFYFDKIPRLSVDIDLNYIGHLDREIMLKDKPVINEAIHQLFSQNQFELYRNPTKHAGGKMVWRYASVFGQKGNLEVDINYMYREPLWPSVPMPAKLNYENANEIPVLDIHELAAGKLSALFSRNVSRDLFDAHHLLTKSDLNIEKLRLAFVIYLTMTEINVSNLNAGQVRYNLTDIRNRLLPVLHQESLPRKLNEIQTWAGEMVTELQNSLSKILPLNKTEIKFILEARDGNIQPELITDDSRLYKVIQSHPAILWKLKKLVS